MPPKGHRTTKKGRATAAVRAEAFAIYLETRSQARAAEAVGVRKATICTWSEEGKWAERAAAFDAAELDAVTVEAKKKASKRRAAVYDAVDSAISVSRAWIAECARAIRHRMTKDPDDLKPRDLRDSIEALAAAERITGPLSAYAQPEARTSTPAGDWTAKFVVNIQEGPPRQPPVADGETNPGNGPEQVRA